MNQPAVRDKTSKRTGGGNLQTMLDEYDLLEMPFDFRIYLMGNLPILVPMGVKQVHIH